MMSHAEGGRFLRSLAVVTVILLVGLTAGTAGAAQATGAYLGVMTRDLDAAMLEALNFDEDGVLIEEVLRDTPAEAAGLKAGDIITMIGDRKVNSVKSLKRALWRLDPGDETTVVTWSKGKKNSVKVTVVEKPEMTFGSLGAKTLQFFGHPDSSGSFSGSMKREKKAFLGVELQELSGQLAEYFGIKDEAGVLISNVTSESAAEKGGIKAGDVILSIGGKAVESPSDVRELVRSHNPGDEVDISLMRERKKITRKVTLGEREMTVSFDPEFFGAQVKDVMKDIQIRYELDGLREELKELRVKVKEMAD